MLGVASKWICWKSGLILVFNAIQTDDFVGYGIMLLNTDWNPPDKNINFRLINFIRSFIHYGDLYSSSSVV